MEHSASKPHEAERGGTADVGSASRRATKRGATGARGSRSRLRMIYFSIAAAWGFVVGTGAVLGAMVASGRQPEAGPWMIGALVAALGVAIAGGCCAAVAYRDARGAGS